jgi:outer membrane protein TolC
MLITFLSLCAVAAGPPLQIDDAIRRALENNERAHIADDRLAAAEARVKKARAFFFPDLTLRGSYTRRAHEGVQNGFVVQGKNGLLAAANLSITLFDARSIPLFKRARLEREAAQLSALEEKRLLAFEVAAAFLATLSLEELERAAITRLDFAEQSLVDARARFEAELVSSNDVTRPELDRASAERDLYRARAEVQNAKSELGYLIGSPVEALAQPDLIQATRSSTLSARAQLVERADAARLDLLARRKQTEAVEQAAFEPKLRFIPSLSLDGEINWTNEPRFERSTDGFVTVNLFWSLYDGGERYADAEELGALARIARLEEDAARRRVSVEIDRALTGLSASRGAKQQAEIAVVTAKRNAAEILELYRQGLARALEVADANASLFDANVSYAREQYGLLGAYLDLFIALGLDPTGKEWTVP